MDRLCCIWVIVNEILDAVGWIVNQPTVSHHLKILMDADLVLVRQEGRQRFYTLNQAHLTRCCGVLVEVFAPDYSAKIVPISEIQVVSRKE